MQPSHFTSYFPVAFAAGVHWVEWYEVLLANATLLVRCVPTTSHSLPDQATTVLLDFGRVIALRGSADPFNLEDPDIQEVLPRRSAKPGDRRRAGVSRREKAHRRHRPQDQKRITVSGRTRPIRLREGEP